MKYQIDQSIKIEQTEKDTILALSNDKKFSLVLKARDKRALQAKFRASNQPGVFIYFVFAALLAIMFKTIKPKQKVHVDHEYLGHEDIIRLKVLQILTKQKISFEFDFVYVGKESPAHALAAKVATGKIKANKIVSKEDILKIVFPKEKDRVSQKGPRAV